MAKDLKMTDNAIKYMVSRRYVISSDLYVGSFVAGHKPYSILKADEGKIKAKEARRA